MNKTVVAWFQWYFLTRWFARSLPGLTKTENKKEKSVAPLIEPGPLGSKAAVLHYIMVTTNVPKGIFHNMTAVFVWKRSSVTTFFQGNHIFILTPSARIWFMVKIPRRRIYKESFSLNNVWNRQWWWQTCFQGLWESSLVNCDALTLRNTIYCL